MNPNLIVQSENKPLPHARPEEVGIPPQAFTNFVSQFDDQMVCVHGFVAVRHGKICGEGYWDPLSKEWLHRMYSSTKTFVAMAVGYMIDEGLVGPDDYITDYFSEYFEENAEIPPALRRLTIRNMLMMSTCHKSTTYKNYDFDDWAKSFFVQPPSHLPGFVYAYDTSSAQVLGKLVEKLTGLSFVEYLRPRLFVKIGVSEEAFSLTDPSGTAQGGSGLFITTRDFAKVAMTCMQGGLYDGEQVIPKWFIEEGTSKLINNYMNASVDQRQGYGYMFWRLRNNGFNFLGMGGQIAVCLPDKDFVIVTTGDSQWNANYAAEMFNNVWINIYPYLNDEPIENDDEAYAAMQAKMESLSIPTVPVLAEETVAEQINGKTYSMEENPMGITEIRFTFAEDGDTGTMEFTNAKGNHALLFGINHQLEQEAFPGYDYGCITSAGWQDANSLCLVSYIIDEQYAALGLNAAFHGDEIVFELKNTAESWAYMPFMTEYSGFASGKIIE